MAENTPTFGDFALDPRILEAISALGFVTPTPIQIKAIPQVIAGRDVMGAAMTGTGKTAGYGLPALQRIAGKANTSASPARHPVRVLVLTPTRELADQVNSNLTDYASRLPLRVGVVYGGVDIRPQSDMLRRGVEVLTATPGRLLDHIEGKSVVLNQVEIVVLDEADRMLDMGFLPDISRILSCLPPGRQNLMFSATFSPEIRKLAASFLRDPVYVEVSRQNAAADTVRQVVYGVHDSEKTEALIQYLRRRAEENESDQALVFVNARITCRRLARTLQNAGLKADAIHGDKTQEERTAVLEAFREGRLGILVATDVAARGLDIEQLPVVVNYDVPYAAEDYVHRIGRTGRAGARGLAVMLATGADNRLLEAIERLTRQKLPPQKFEFDRRPSMRDEGRGRGSYREGGRHRRAAYDDGSVRVVPVARETAPYDPFLDEPYREEALREEQAREDGPEAAPKKRQVSALFFPFGGNRP